MEESKESLKINNYLYWVYLIGFFLVILQVINVFPLWSDPGDWGKAIFSRIILAVLTFLFLYQIVFRKIELSALKSKIRSVNPLFWLLAGLFFVYLLATIFSINPHFSLWGNPFRSGGFINFSFYIIFALLVFLIVKDKDWKKILDFLIIISIFVSLIAVFQQFGILGKIFIPFSARPMSTMGNPILLSIYLLLATFLPISLGLKEKRQFKKIFYYFSSFLFFFVAIFLTQTRGTYLGFFAGFLFFLFAYPKKTPKQSLVNTRDATGQAKIKLYAGALLVVAILGMFFLKNYLDSHLDFYKKLPPLFAETLDRGLSLFEGINIGESRTSVWKVSLFALKERFVLGYGPENFMIAFDKYYDPSLPKIGDIAAGEDPTQWFDRAHNFIFDIPISAGIPALIIYLCFFGTLIWQLQKIKYANSPPPSSPCSNSGNANGHIRIYPQNAVISHGLQATFLGYLIALFSSFDNVSTYLISFLLIGYSLHLISEYNPNLPARQRPEPQALAGGRMISESTDSTNKKPEVISHKLFKYRKPIISILFIILVIFIWNYNIRPLVLNKNMNVALFYAGLRQEKSCEKAYNIINEISDRIPNSIIENYLNQKSTFVIYGCNDKLKKEKPEKLVEQNIKILENNIRKNPQYTTNWILIGEYTSILIKGKNSETENVFILNEETKKLKDEANYYFSKALELSPKRQIILKDWADTNIITGEYQKAEGKLQKCIDLNPSYARCYWYMALNKGYQKDYDGLKKFTALAQEKGIIVESQEFLQELVNMYIRNNDYNGLAEVYPKLIPLTSDPLEKAQLHASFAATYKELGDIKKAREEILKIKEIIPLLPKEHQQAVKNDVESFLEILK